MNTATPVSDLIVKQFLAGEAHSDGLILTLRDLELKLTAALAEIDRLDVAGIHSCHANCQKSMCVMRRELTAVTKQRDEMTKYANKLAHGFPDGMLPKDFEVLREANLGLAVELTAVTKQRDELKNKLEKSKSYKNVMKRDNAELRKQRDEAVNNYETAQLLSVRVEEQLNRLAKLLSS